MQKNLFHEPGSERSERTNEQTDKRVAQYSMSLFLNHSAHCATIWLLSPETWSEMVERRPEVIDLLHEFKADLLILSKVPMFPGLLGVDAARADHHDA